MPCLVASCMRCGRRMVKAEAAEAGAEAAAKKRETA